MKAPLKSKKLFQKCSNHNLNQSINMNSNNNNVQNILRRRKIFSDSVANKNRKNKNPISRNSVNKFYGMKRGQPISMILKKKKYFH